MIRPDRPQVSWRLAALSSLLYRFDTAWTSSPGSALRPCARRNKVVKEGLVVPTSSFATKERFNSAARANVSWLIPSDARRTFSSAANARSSAGSWFERMRRISPRALFYAPCCMIQSDILSETFEAIVAGLHHFRAGSCWKAVRSSSSERIQPSSGVRALGVEASDAAIARYARGGTGARQ